MTTELDDVLEEYRSIYERSLGYTSDEFAVALVAVKQHPWCGSVSVDRLADAVKEFCVRKIERGLANSPAVLRAALRHAEVALRSAQPVEAHALAVTMFGTAAEDLDVPTVVALIDALVPRHQEAQTHG